MPLDPIVQAIVENSRSSDRPASLAEGGVEKAREGYLVLRAAGGEDAPVASVVDRTLPGPAGEIPVRIYTPEGEGPFPVVVYYHGGGFTIGSVDGHDPVTRRMASESGAIVVSVEYRLAPEHRFPAAVEDAYAALAWVGEHTAEIGGDPARIAVAGDSAGGNLAAVVAVLARDAGGPTISLQVLIYPTTDGREPSIHASHVENADGPFLTAQSMQWFASQYAAKPEDREDPRWSVLLTPDLTNLPPALLITGQYDPLRDEGIAYGERLREAGNTVTMHNYETMPHVFVQMWGVLGPAKECMTEICEAIRKAFAA